MYCVVMFEQDVSLPPWSQVNEVFGPFDTEQAAIEWTERMESLFQGSRHWLISPLSQPSQ